MRLMLLMLLTALLSACASAAGPAETRRIAISFDDVPRHPGAFFTPEERTRRIIADLRGAGVPQAALFVTTRNLEQPYGAGGERRIADYVAAGHVIANHSHTHPHLNAMPAADFIADIDRAESWLRDQPGYRPWFRFPFLDEGGSDKAKRDIARAALAARNLRNGYVTVDGYDWHLENLSIAAKRAGKTMDQGALRDLYVETQVEAARYYDELARKTIGRSPAHVLLLHETDLAALYIGDLVRALKADGWKIISADEAYSDPLQTAQPDVPSAQGTLIEALAWEKGLPAPRWYDRNNERVLTELFNTRVLKEATPE